MIYYFSTKYSSRYTGMLHIDFNKNTSTSSRSQISSYGFYQSLPITQLEITNLKSLISVCGGRKVSWTRLSSSPSFHHYNHLRGDFLKSWFTTQGGVRNKRQPNPEVCVVSCASSPDSRDLKTGFPWNYPFWHF